VSYGKGTVVARSVGWLASYSYDLKFVVVSSGGVTPQFKLIPLSGGGTPILNRSRTHELLLTFGPTVPMASPHPRSRFTSTSIPSWDRHSHADLGPKYIKPLRQSIADLNVFRNMEWRLHAPPHHRVSQRSFGVGNQISDVLSQIQFELARLSYSPLNQDRKTFLCAVPSE
jgi:hypothetical protein